MEKVRAPANALLAVGGLYVVALLVSVAIAAIGGEVDADVLRELDIPQETIEDFQKLQEQKGVLWNVVPLAVEAVLVGLVVLGSIRMRELRSYWTCVAGAVAAALPCTTVTCCCLPALAGIPVGIWALVVLSKEDVRRAFQARAAPGES